MLEPYWSDDTCQLYVGDMREVLPALGVKADLVLADPPYGKETSLEWDRWPDGWLQVAAGMSSSLWCFGSMRMFGDRWGEFGVSDWNLSQDIIGKDPEGQPVFGDVHTVWEKHNGSSFHDDRFRRVHEHVLHFYQGAWDDQHRDVQTTPDATKHSFRRKARPPHMGVTGSATYLSEDGGPRLMRSVIYSRSMHGRAIHPTEKPVRLLDPMIKYACPEGGLVVDPFAGSCSTLEAAKLAGRRAIGIEGNEMYAERGARRLEERFELFRSAEPAPARPSQVQDDLFSKVSDGS